MTAELFIGLAVGAAACVAVAVSVLFVARAQVRAVREQADAALQSQQELYSRILQTARDSFGAVAQQVLDDRGRRLDEIGANALHGIVDPLKERLSEYERKVEAAKASSDRFGQHMDEQLRHLSEFAAQARAYTNALVGGNKLQGLWGENILRRTLEASGLREPEHFETQKSQEDGVPDVWVYDVRNRHVILIDAKTNIKDYLEAYNAADDNARREQALKAHARSVRRQIDNLAAKEYAGKCECLREGYTVLPLVGMFCPSDTVLEAALSADPGLLQYAYDRGVVLVTPLTLLGLLWLVSWGWQQKAVERQFDDIRDQGRKVVEAVDLLLGDVKGMASGLKSAQTAFESLSRRLCENGEGRTSIKRIAEKLVASGANPVNKTLKNL